MRIEGLFQTITALFSKILQSFKGNAQSQATLSVRNITFFEKKDLGGRVYVKKIRTHVLSALCLLYFVSIVAALFLNSAKNPPQKNKKQRFGN